MSIPVDPEYAFLATLPENPPLSHDTLNGFRAVLPSLFPKCESLEGVKREYITFPGLEGAGDNSAFVYSPEESSNKLRPALFWIHGGGYVAGSADLDHLRSSHFVKDLGIVVFNVNYRLAPEHPFPAGLDDLYHALKYVHNNADKYGIDVNNIGVAGGSAGAGLAAALALKVRDTKEFKFSFQYLLYPMIDDRTCLREHKPEVGKYVWPMTSSVYAWGAYLGNTPIGDASVSAYAAPSRATSLAGLPPTIIFVGELDLFRDEDVEFAQRLWKEGVSTELVVFPGAYHAFELQPSKLTTNFTAQSNAALKRLFKL